MCYISAMSDDSYAPINVLRSHLSAALQLVQENEELAGLRVQADTLKVMLRHLSSTVDAHAADVLARAVPLALGGTVAVRDRNKAADEPHTVVKIARKYIYLQNQWGHAPEPFDPLTGRDTKDGYRMIVPNDVHRIRTFLPIHHKTTKAPT